MVFHVFCCTAQEGVDGWVGVGGYMCIRLVFTDVRGFSRVPFLLRGKKCDLGCNIYIYLSCLSGRGFSCMLSCSERGFLKVRHPLCRLHGVPVVCQLAEVVCARSQLHITVLWARSLRPQSFSWA